MNEFEQATGEAGKKAERAFPELIRRSILAGIGGLFSGEEGVRSAIGDLKLPKEVVHYLMQQFGKTKDELIQRISREVREFLRSSHLTEELKRVLHSTSLQISTTVKFVNNDESIKPNVTTRWNIGKDAQKSGTKRRRTKKTTPT